MRRKRILTRPLPEAADSLNRLHPVLRRVYLARGVRSEEDLDYALARLPPPACLPGIEALTAQLAAALVKQKRILVVGDYDADGACGCALAVQGLRALGAKYVDFLVPDRFRFGYGLTPALVEAALARRPEVLLTVDSGTACLAGVEAAKAKGLRVLITDHHLPGPRLPAADAIVNPKLGEGPLGQLAGVGVMFYALCALRARLRKEGWFARQGVPEPKLSRWLDLVALGTVADVVPLDGVNRILVHQGLQRLRAGRGNLGLLALAEVAGCRLESLSAQDLGFALAPRLNAAGRLEDMSLGIRCLLAKDLASARALAQQLDALNRQRRAIQAQMQAAAFALVDALDLEAPGTCLFDPNWHEGVVGVLAGRIRDRLGRPAIAFAPGRDGNLKGSARSIPEIHIRDLIAEIDALRPGLILRYGGHARAAGVTLRAESYAEFAALFSERLAVKLRDLVPQDVIYTDGSLDAADFSLPLAESLRAAGPWGPGFPEPLFCGEFEVRRATWVKDRHLKLSLRPPGGPWVEAIAFDPAEPGAFFACRQLRLAYRLTVDEFRGARGVQLQADYLEPIG
nr:single-stranded-DNA-specific exonuclease RecJ [uncultured Gammaproteobacteria bacterium]